MRKYSQVDENGDGPLGRGGDGGPLSLGSYMLQVQREHGVRRNAEQNFGHPYHYLIDQIQIAVQKSLTLSFIPGISTSRFLSW